MTPSWQPTASKGDDDAGLYGVHSAAAYLGFTESWVTKLAIRDNKLRYWQETPPFQRDDGTIQRGSALVFKREWLDDYQRGRRKPGRQPGSQDKQPRKRPRE